MIHKTYKLIFGVFLLIVVDLIWVSSSELTKFLYQNENFDKPFFCTYFKTSMFTIYLLIMGLLTPWKNACESNRSNYTLVEQNVEDEILFSNGNSLSDSTYVPVKCSHASESDDSGIRIVRFNKLAEVREMSPHEANEALMSRLSYTASIRIRRQKTNHKTARTALMFCVLWFIANYLFQLALEANETALVSLVSSTSTFFTLILAAIYPSSNGDRFTLSKLVAVFFCIAGVAMVTITDVHGLKMTKGVVVLALFSAFFYASYLVLVKHKSDTEEKIDIPLFFGFVGLWNLLLMWPIFFVLNFTEIELFELPNHRQCLILFLNGFIGTVLSEALWLWSCFLTSSLIGTIAMTLQIPLTMLFDAIFKSKMFPSLFYFGTIPMCASLLFVGFLIENEDSDPLWRFIKVAYRKFILCRRPIIVRISDLDEQRESLMNDHDH